MSLDEVVDYFGSPSKVAKALGISRQAVALWAEVPELRQMQIQVLTGNKLVAAKSEQASINPTT